MSFAWLKRYMPSGIYARAALILLLPVVFLQLVVTVIFAQRHFEGVTLQMTDTVLGELALIERSIAAAPDRAAVAEQVAEDYGTLNMTATPVDEAEVATENRRVWYDYSGVVMTERLTDQLDNLLAIDH